MIRLAHLIDIHLSTPNLEWTRADWFNKRVAAWFNFRWLGRRHRFRYADQVLALWRAEIHDRNIEHVVFSGDATALGFTSEISKAAEMLGVGRLPGLAVPGNHDYCTRPAAASGNFERAFGPWHEGLRVDGAVYPFAQKIGHTWLVAVNTSTGNRWAWDAGGEAGPEQRQRLARLLAQLDSGPRILVTHYPVCLASGKLERRSHGLRDMHELVDVAAKGRVSLWLHGHRHNSYHFQKSPYAPFPIICIGSATQSNLWSYGEYTIDGYKLSCVRRRYDLVTNRFEDAETFDLILHGEEPVLS